MAITSDRVGRCATRTPGAFGQMLSSHRPIIWPRWARLCVLVVVVVFRGLKNRGRRWLQSPTTPRLHGRRHSGREWRCGRRSTARVRLRLGNQVRSDFYQLVPFG